MTIIAAIVILTLVAGIVGAIVKRLFHMAAMFAVFALVIVGIVVFVISRMH